MRVGIVDIDTTHPWPIANYINATGRAQVVAITDSGETWQRDHVARFASRLTPPARVLDHPLEMLGKVDAVMFCGNRYDLRIEQVRPFLDKGLPIYVDKPAVGRLKQVRILEEYVRAGARVLFGSSLPFCPELKEVWRRVTAGCPSGLIIIGWRSLFEYGIHATDIAFNLLQSPPRRVQWGAFGPADCVWVELANGQDLLLCTGLPTCNWQVSCMTSEGLFTTPLDLALHRGCHYDLLAQAFLQLAETGKTPVAPQWHLEGIKTLIAADRSRESGRVVAINELADEDGFDGKDYAESYRAVARQADPEGYMSPDYATLLRGAGRPQFSGSIGASSFVGFAKKAARRILGPNGIQIAKQTGRRILGPRGVRIAKRLARR